MTSPSWPWIAASGRIGVAAMVAGLLVCLRGGVGCTFAFGGALGMALVLIQLAAFTNNNELARRREIARIRGTRRAGPAQIALSTVASLFGGLTLVTRGEPGPMLNRVEWALFVASLLTGIWFVRERRVKDRDLGRESGTSPDSPGDRSEIPGASPNRSTNPLR